MLLNTLVNKGYSINRLEPTSLKLATKGRSFGNLVPNEILINDIEIEIIRKRCGVKNLIN